MQGTQSISLYIVIILTCARCWLVSPLTACCWSSLTCFILAERSGARSGHQPPAPAWLCRQAASRSWLAEGGSSSATTCHNVLIEPLEPLLEPLIEPLEHTSPRATCDRTRPSRRPPGSGGRPGAAGRAASLPASSLFSLPPLLSSTVCCGNWLRCPAPTHTGHHHRRLGDIILLQTHGHCGTGHFGRCGYGASVGTREGL